MKIYVCSSNQGKLRDFTLAGSQAGIAVEPLPELANIAPPDETGVTFEENAIIKAIYYSQFADAPVLADDSGLEVDALGGEPGVFSARYAGSGASDNENNRLLLERLRNAMNRHARFVCVIALARAGSLITTVRGSVSGEISAAPRGSEGFGYDPLFFYPPLGCTFGELSPEQKFGVSHRGNAARQLAEFLKHA